MDIGSVEEQIPSLLELISNNESEMQAGDDDNEIEVLDWDNEIAKGKNQGIPIKSHYSILINSLISLTPYCLTGVKLVWEWFISLLFDRSQAYLGV